MTQPYNHPIKVQVTTKDVKKENRLPYFREGDCGYILRVPIELANTDYIQMIFFRARKSANVGPVAQCTWQEETQEHQAKQQYTMLIIYLNS